MKTDNAIVHTIDAGIGEIEWSTDNLQLADLMERLEEKLKTMPPNEILK